MKTQYNFCAGPAMLPVDVMQQAQQEFNDWQGQGCSVMEISHRSDAFVALARQAEQDLRELLSIPDNYRVLFLHGGGRGQFSAIPLNLSRANQSADYFVSGAWSQAAYEEGQRFLQARTAGTLDPRLDVDLKGQQLNCDSQAAYFHYCPNETIDGVEINELPEVGNVPLIADLSSTILSQPLDVSRFAMLYAGAQKNIGPSGLSLVIIRDDMLDRGRTAIPSIYDYQLQVKNDSMYNTPPTFAWYLAGLVFKWLKQQGGVEQMARLNQAKAELLYGCIDENDFYVNNIAGRYRSRMNVPFQLVDAALDKTFLQEAEQAGLTALKGHRSVGGMRASIYNAMPIEGVRALTDFMADFARRYG